MRTPLEVRRPKFARHKEVPQRVHSGPNSAIIAVRSDSPVVFDAERFSQREAGGSMKNLLGGWCPGTVEVPRFRE